MRKLALLMLVGALACSREQAPDVSQNSPSQSTTVSGSTVGGETNTALMNPTMEKERDLPSGAVAAAAPTQQVDLIEYQINMPHEFPAGKLAFNLQNAGKEDHGFEIEGNGLHQQSTVLKRGDHTSLEVDLKPGTYTVYCPVDGHKDKGMRTTITVR
ncbi:MAG TPA: cupredoxin domain-containing protein [Thermoanaerobaculia bacterium]|jgi:plastocyanin